MEDFIKQIRVRISGQENEGDPSSNKKIAPTKTTSFKAEKKKLQNWVQRQFSRQMSQDFDTNSTEKAIAVAAVAYAVLLLKPSLPQTKSRKDDRTVAFQEFGEVSKPSSDESSKKIPEILNSKVSDAKIPDKEPAEKRVRPEASIKKPPTSTDKPRYPAPSLEKVQAITDESSNEGSMPLIPPFSKRPSFTDKPRSPAPSLEKAPAIPDKSRNEARMPPFMKGPSFTDKPVPSIETTATFPDNLTSSTEKAKNFPDKPAASIPKPPISPEKPAILMQEIHTLTEQQLNKTSSINPDGAASLMPTPRPNVGSTSTSPTPSSKPLSKADEWELAELAKIKNRYEEANERIRSWENKKKVKARRKLDNIEGELAMRRAKASEKYQVEMQRIQQIVGAANEKAKERQLYDEAKVKQKANVIRQTGKTPASCFCC